MHLSPDPPDVRPLRRRPRLVLLGVGGWCAALLVGYGLESGRLPVRHWSKEWARANEPVGPSPGVLEPRGEVQRTPARSLVRPVEPVPASALAMDPAEQQIVFSGPGPLQSAESGEPRPDDAAEPLSGESSERVLRGSSYVDHPAIALDPWAGLPGAEADESRWDPQSLVATEQRTGAGASQGSADDARAYEEQTAEGPGRLETALRPDTTKARGPEPRGPGDFDDAVPSDAADITSCEGALRAYREELDLSTPQRAPADVSREQYAAILENGAYLQPCNVPERVSLEICAAIQHGRVVGITIRTDPEMPAVARCVAKVVRRLFFPVHPRLDVTTTRFD